MSGRPLCENGDCVFDDCLSIDCPDNERCEVNQQGLAQCLPDWDTPTFIDTDESDEEITEENPEEPMNNEIIDEADDILVTNMESDEGAQESTESASEVYLHIAN